MKNALSQAGLFFVLTLAPVFFTTLTRDIFAIPKALVISIGIALIWLSRGVFHNVSFRGRVLTPHIVPLLAAAVMSALLSVDTPLSVLGPHQNQFHALLPMAVYVMTYYAAAHTDAKSDRIVLFALLGGAAVCIPAISQIELNGLTFMRWTIQGGRAGSTFGSPIYLGSYMALLLPIAWERLTRDEDRESPVRYSALYASLFVLIAISLLASRSRGSLAAGAAGVILVDLLRGKFRRAAILVGVAGVALFAIFQARGNGDRADSGRIEVWRAAIQAFKLHPIFGWGPDTFSLAFQRFMSVKFILAEGNDQSTHLSAHNSFLQALVTMGVVGLLAYCYFLAGVARSLIRSLGGDPEAVGIAGGIFALFLNASFNPIPMAVLAVAACLLGSLDRWEYLETKLTPVDRLRTAGVTLAAFALVAVFVVIVKAERHQRRGEDLWQMGKPIEAAEAFNQAAIVNPFDLWYTQRQLDYFWKVIGKLPGTNKEILAAYSHNISENIARLHPAHPTAHELRSISFEFEGDMIGRDRYWEAFNEMAVAERLAPGFSAYRKRRECIARRVKSKSPQSCYDQGPQQAAKS